MRALLALLVPLVLVAGVVPASPLACADPCVVLTNYLGYSPPVVEIESGDAVVWRSTGGGHVQADTGFEYPCFVTVVEGGADSDPAVFRIVDGTLRANSTEMGETTCGNAVALPDGAFALSYECVIHPNMQAAIVVR